MEKRGADGVWYMFHSTEGAWRRGALMVSGICSTARRGRGEEGR